MWQWGRWSKVADFGIFVELEGGVEGLIHISEAGLDQQAKLEEKFKLMDEVTAKIIKVDREERKIALSLRDHELDTDRRKVDEFHATQRCVGPKHWVVPRSRTGSHVKARTITRSDDAPYLV